MGYGIAYPFGVVGIVLFVQLYPKLVGCDVKEEARRLSESLRGKERAEDEDEGDEKKLRSLECFGMLPLALTIALGVLLGSVKIPLPGGMSFSLGTAGGPLFIGLLIGHFGHIGPICLTTPSSTLKVMRELGLCLFLLGAGTEAGHGFVAVLMEQGVKLFLFGVTVTLVPLVLACLAARLMKLATLTTLGSVCGGRTSTPALGALVNSCGTEDVAVSYAATYPFALICVVLGSQIMALLW